MDAYRVSETEADLPRLVDRAAAGEQVLITRGEHAVAELRAVAPARDDLLQALMAGLEDMPQSPVSSLDLLRQIY